MFRCVCFAVLCISFLGCGNGEDFKVAPVKGKVTCNGKPVPGGTIIFSPMTVKEGSLDSGKKGSAPIQEDGTFVVSTYGNQDGAVIGKHLIMIDFTPENDDDKRVKIDCKVPDNLEKEVVDGSNDIQIDL